MRNLALLGVLALALAGCPQPGCETDASCVSDDTDTDTDSDTDSDTDTDTDSDTDTDTDSDTDTDTDPGNGLDERCQDQGRFRCDVGNNCVRVCGVIGGEFVQYQLGEDEFLYELQCNVEAGEDQPFRMLISDIDTDEYVLINVVEEQFEPFTFPIGRNLDNSQVEFSQDGGAQDSWGTTAKPVGDDNPPPVFGDGVGEVLIWNPPVSVDEDSNGQVLMKLLVTEAYKKVNGKLSDGDSSPKTGVVQVELQAVCR